MILEMKKRISTGHRDCCGDMILRGDTVVGLNGFGTVIWFGRKWWILHPGRRAEPLNRYPAAELRRVSGNGTIGPILDCPVKPLSRDKETIVPSIVPPLSHKQNAVRQSVISIMGQWDNKNIEIVKICN